MRAVEYGPLINEAGFRKVQALVGSAVQSGATVVTGGKRAPETADSFTSPP